VKISRPFAIRASVNGLHDLQDRVGCAGEYAHLRESPVWPVPFGIVAVQRDVSTLR
jgi:hypothetical protein